MLILEYSQMQAIYFIFRPWLESCEGRPIQQYSSRAFIPVTYVV